VTAEISKMESQLKELEKQKMEAEKLKKEKDIREAARKTEELQAKLKARQLEQERLAKEKERKAKLEEEARRMEQEEAQKQDVRARQKAAEEARLNELRRKLAEEQTKVKEAKQEVMSLEMARKEVALLESKINKVKSFILSEKEKAINRLKEDYKPLKEKLNKPYPPKDQFETTDDFNLRVNKHWEKIRALNNRYLDDYNKIQNKYDTEISSRTKVFKDQIEELKNKEYSAGTFKVELRKYIADRALYVVKLSDPKGNTWFYFLPIEPRKARGLNERKELLKAQGYYLGIDNTNSFSRTILIDPILGKLPFDSGIKVIKLRSNYKKLKEDDVITILKRKGFYEKNWNKSGDFINQFESVNIKGDKVVIDLATGLMWHQSGSTVQLTLKKSKKWIKALNSRGYAGYQDWRLPTVEEGLSLMENSGKKDGFYIDPLFSREQRWIWTGDRIGSGEAWTVIFRSGIVSTVSVYGGSLSEGDYARINEAFYVRPVRSLK
jgi:chemotaxis protein histidine kinase CheA